MSKFRLDPKLMYPPNSKKLKMSLGPEALCILYCTSNSTSQNIIPYIGTKILILPLFSHNSTQKASLNKPRVQIYTKFCVDYESVVKTQF